MRFAKEGLLWVTPPLAVAVWWHIISLPTKYSPWAYFWVITFPSAVGILLLASFFRDPARHPPASFAPQTQFLSPADGNLCSVEKTGDSVHLYVEMHYYNVHVVRSPAPATVREVIHQRGRHHLVYFIKKARDHSSKAIQKNARTIVTLETDTGLVMRYYMICGAFFRRARAHVKVGQKLAAGDRVGMIAFGSTVKLSVPSPHMTVLVNVGDKVRAGETIIGEMQN